MNKKVLIVEDEFIVANALRLILQEAGYSVNGIAASAGEADENLQKHKPDIVLLDIRLNGKRSGIDFARKLKAENIAFIYLSANSSQKILEEAKATEPYGFLVKPFREKDLLVMLDIALYRHKHSLESKLRREEFLQKQLVEISNEVPGAKQKLLETARVIQAYIPFDLIVSGYRPPDAAQFNDTGYLRIGFNEYQFIGEEELITITGLKQKALSTIIENSHTDTGAVIYTDRITKQKPGIPSLQKILFDCFNLESYLVFPVFLSNGLSVHYFFYSRQCDTYTKDHITLLSRLKICLTDVAEKMSYSETSSTSTMSQAGSFNKKQAEVVSHPAFKSVIGNHPLLLAALDLTAQVAPYNTSVLILGESGTGKEKVAQFIHSLSPRKNAPFIKVKPGERSSRRKFPARSLLSPQCFSHYITSFAGSQK